MEQPWRPRTIERLVRSFPTSACTTHVRTDQGDGYLKALESPEGPHILACEYIATNLAQWLGLRTFDYSIIQLGPDEPVIFHNGQKAKEGPAFITRGEIGETWSGSKEQLEEIENKEDIGRLVVFDTWTLNCDRYSIPIDGEFGRPRVNRDNVFFSTESDAGKLILKAMDHTHCFSCGRELKEDLKNIGRIQDPRVFGLFPEFLDLLKKEDVERAATDLRSFDSSVLGKALNGVPDEWEVSKEALEALGELICRRAKFVADSIVSKIWPQQEIPFDIGSN